MKKGPTYMEWIIVIVSGLSTFFIMPYIRELLLESKIVDKNFLGKEIPVGMGITFIPVMIINVFFIYLLYYSIPMNNIYVSMLFIFLMGILSMAFIGIIDDLMGNRNTLGFKGHMGSLMKGKLTTGGFKAVMGGLVSLLISLVLSNTLIEIVSNTLLLALFTNLLNLLDLRPGRALKSHILIVLIFLILGVSQEVRSLTLAVTGFSIAYLPQDIKAKSMMGDVGSNSLGISLGIIAVLSFSIITRFIFLFILLIIHIIAERYSISKLIESNRVLRYLDQLGRVKE